MDEGRIIFQRLHKVRLHGLLQQHRHRAVGLDIAAVDRRAISAIGDNDIAQTFLQVFQIKCQTQDRHNFGRHRNVKPSLTRESIRNAPERCHNIAQCPIIHIHHTAPDNTTFVDLQLVTPIDMIVDHRR